MSNTKTFKLPPIGLRIIKSAIAVLLCYPVNLIRGNGGIIFYSQLAALWCIQIYRSNTKKNAIQRFVGTTIGGIFGLLYILLQKKSGDFLGNYQWNETIAVMSEGVIISLFIVLLLYTTVLLNKKQASYFSCVVFLSIVVNHIGDANPYLFAWNRFLDTMIGIVIGVCINDFRLPIIRQKDTLFISGLDHTLLCSNNSLSQYSKIELNQMLENGLKFTISTTRTPASLLESLAEIHLTLPVIAMDGAVLYDIKTNSYLKAYVISAHKAKEIKELIRGEKLCYFTNIIIDDTLLIYYEEIEDEVVLKFIKEHQASPYRNYIHRESPHDENVVYFMIFDKKEKLVAFRKLLEEKYGEDLRIVFCESEEYPEYAHIRIYNLNATKENMIRYLKESLDVEKVVTMGTIPGRYDYLIQDENSNQVVRYLRRLFEPMGIKCKCIHKE